MPQTIVIDLHLQPKQTLVFKSTAQEILFGGAAGGGKSHLLRVIAIYYALMVDGIQIYLFRRQVSDLEKNHIYGSGSLLVLLKNYLEKGRVKYNAQNKTIKFYNGSIIHLNHLKNDLDLVRFQGVEIHILLIDELTHFTERQYRFLRSRTRLGDLSVPKEIKERLPLIIGASNPGSIGHVWVKRTFITPVEAGKIKKSTKKEGGRTRQFIPSRLEDNYILLKNDPDYEDRLSGLGDPMLVKAMREGNWDIVVGGALDDVWSEDHIRLPVFNVPSGWKLDRSFDWGSTHPFSVGWWAESDGTEATLPDGSIFCPPPRSLIRIDEWYGTREIGSNEGLRYSPKQIAEGILEKEASLRIAGRIKSAVKPGPADNQIRDMTRSDVKTIEKAMREHGVTWEKSDKTPGSRVNGLTLLRQRLLEAKKDHPENPAIYFCSNCTDSFSVLPVLPRDPTKVEDVDTKSEDHIYDEIRYRILKSDVNAMSIKISTAH